MQHGHGPSTQVPGGGRPGRRRDRLLRDYGSERLFVGRDCPLQPAFHPDRGA